MFSMKLGRNDPCPCGIGKKYKNCCLGKEESRPSYWSAAASDDLNLLGELFNAGRYVELENLARSLLKLYPNSGVVWKLFGPALHMQGQDALPALRKAAELLPNDAEAHGNLAAILRTRGQLEAAAASSRRALQIKPDFAGGHNNLGVILQDLGRLDEAVASYRRALEVRPDFVEAHNHFGWSIERAWAI
jgi:protein O-GlcNAc transferase